MSNKNIKILFVNPNPNLKEFYNTVKSNYPLFETSLIHDIDEYNGVMNLKDPFKLVIVNIDFDSNYLENSYFAEVEQKFNDIPIIYITKDEFGYIERNKFDNSPKYRLNFPFKFSEFEYLLKFIFNNKNPTIKTPKILMGLSEAEI